MESRKEEKSSKELDEEAHAAWSRAWSSISPESPLLAWMDWASHLATSPGKRAELSRLALDQLERIQTIIKAGLSQSDDGQSAGALPPLSDRRFADPSWGQWPFNLFGQSFEMQRRWWGEATRDVWGVDPHHQRLVAFGVEQWMEMLSPSNLAMLNPVVIRKSLDENGANLARGLSNLFDDIARRMANQPPAGTENFVVGKDVAATPGKVVFRNRLIELIQYEPTTEVVHPEPILIVPAWIMKYYILDLSPHNSLIRYLVDQGFTVFCISWKNPDPGDRDMGMAEYLDLGFHAALSTVNTIAAGARVHAAGYCLGGTLLSIAAAAMARDLDDRLASVSLLAAQTDFSEPGELGLLIDESQIALLEAQMAEVGYLHAEQMTAAFQLLRSYDLFWSRIINEYLLGDRRPMNDLMAWNADGTRLPAKMHSQYLRRLYLQNDLASGRYQVGGKPISLGDINLPIFCVGTTTDHVAPWRSVYKLHLLTATEVTFALTNGGHNAGIVSEPGRPRRQYQVSRRARGDTYVSPDDWVENTPVKPGSWWPEWADWMAERSQARDASARHLNASTVITPLADAPGDYIKMS
ncbi:MULTISPECIES: PHA/PHB synthase family protein [Hyphomicrobiales]|uniref:Poly-beta-hydroxybutyrate polymerase family protein n=2 Tax=Hyphomicrobiales TaxID=356 RepID=A0A256GMV7_9HYPH|nr:MULTISPECIES: alpha/beta fold hydrolase [Hyphomicrobiales]ANH06153.1 poly-beta-hydroxybutyrate polymerase [Shinella sp. HZN7]MDG3579818.1 alpha/beta fold hydrolase [Rhizobium sp. YJ-22]OYR28497.1 poly-beta-hydroxybutyrate polymerase family protein [Brucella pseudogrignonensis]QRI62602.1 polyhydroxyalkanoic acid synthase [Shinella sp. PSBB067]